MDIRQLRYFIAIVEYGSLSRAAEALRVAQPALSLHLKRLEEEFGCQLVLRTARGVVPTESGRRLAQRAGRLVADVESLRDEVRGLEAAPSGPAVVGIPTSLGPVLTVPLALAVRRTHPAIHLRVVEGLSGHMVEWLHTGHVDIALVFGGDEAGGLTRAVVARERLRLVGRHDDPLLLGRAAMALEDVLKLPLILPGRPHGVRGEVERAALLSRLSVNVVMEIDALEQLKTLVAEGVGYTMMSQRVAGHGPDAHRLASVPIVSPEIERVICFAHPTDRPQPIAVRAVQAIATSLLESLTQGGRWL